MEPELSSIVPQPPNKSRIWTIWKVAIILCIVTGLEFAVALQLPEIFKPFKIWLFVGMTFIKAGYIIGEFMHLAHEKKTLMWTIMLPCVFVLWLIAALFIQADPIYNAIYY